MSRLNGWLKVIIAACFSGLLMFFIGKATESGQYKEKVDQLQGWKVTHEGQVQDKLKEFDQVKITAAENGVILRQIQLDVADIKRALKR